MLIKAKKKFFQFEIAPYYSAVTSTTATWNSSDKDTSITLSGGNLIATKTTVETFRMVRANASASSGKKYWELTVSAFTSAPGGYFVGIANSSQVLTNYVGSSLNSCGTDDVSQTWSINGSGLTAATTGFGLNDVLSIAADFDNSNIWIRVNGGNWNKSGAANPATNTLGQSFLIMNAGPYLPAFSGFENNDACTANFGNSAYAFTPPSGFGNW